MVKDKNNYAVSFVINVHDSTLTKKELEDIAEGLVDELQTSVDAELNAGITGDCSFNVDHLVDPPFTPPGQTMTWQRLEKFIGDHMDKLEQHTDPRDPIAIRMSDGIPLTGARLFRSGQGSGWELWLSDTE